MATSDERLEKLERSLQQARNALQAVNYRISSLETAAGTTTSSPSMVDMRVLGKPSTSPVTKGPGKAGASSCCPSLQQTHLNCAR